MRVRSLRVILLAALTVAGLSSVDAQLRRPRAEVTPITETTSVAPGSVAKVALFVKLPQEFHVQSDKPRDPSLIPTVLSFEPPPGITVGPITYPKATDLKQEGEKEPLAVFGNEFTINAQLTVGKDVAAGDLVIPGRLRYQACDETACYPPARAEAQWTLTVTAKK